MVAGVVILAAATAHAQPLPAEDRALQEFSAATTRYVALHRIIELAVPLEVTSDVEAINRSVRHLAAALRAERRGARPGEFFTEELAAILRSRIATALAEHGYTPGDVLVAEASQGVNSAELELGVNDMFPWIYATGMFPCVLNSLPELPPELQYRLVGRTLVLVDVHASLIVDVLPYALAATELQ
jgi:hypothetical protein